MSVSEQESQRRLPLAGSGKYRALLAGVMSRIYGCVEERDSSEGVIKPSVVVWMGT